MIRREKLILTVPSLDLAVPVTKRSLTELHAADLLKSMVKSFQYIALDYAKEVEKLAKSSVLTWGNINNTRHASQRYAPRRVIFSVWSCLPHVRGLVYNFVPAAFV